ncbi:MAG: hypothetical protein K5922_05130 [Clostridiales bacterium]|nr:hypothetical protein [Clostridiales bacterium]
MSMDHFMEEVAIKRNNTMNRIVYYISWIIMIFSALFAVYSLQVLFRAFDVYTLVFTLASAGIAAYIFFFHDKLLTEYEYTFTNGALDFAEVYNNKRRKSLGSLNVKTVDAFGKVSSGSFQRYLKMPDVKRMNWFLNRDAELYYFFFSKDNNKKMIILEPSEEMVGLIRQYIPRGVYQEN